MKYFDAHCHVQFPHYDADRTEVLARMREAEIGGLVVGVDSTSSKSAIELVAGESKAGGKDLFASVGLHPNDSEEEYDGKLFDELARRPEVVAIGECGLDYYRNDATDDVKKKQKDILEQQIELAVKHDKPLMIHSRPSRGSYDAYHDVIDIVKSKKQTYGDRLRGDMHFYVGGVDEARAFIELGFTLSYTAVVTFARDYDDVIRFAPLTSLLSETDAPYVAPASHRGKRNEPNAVIEVVKAIAEIRGEDEEKVRQTMVENARQLFRII